MPFNILIDQKSIIELPDEWLYIYPDFLDFDPKLPDAFFSAVLQRDIEIGNVVSQAIEDFNARKEENQVLPCNKEYLRGTIIDVPKTSHTKNRKTRTKPSQTSEDKIEVMSNHEIYEKLSASRNAKDSKKRFIWLSNLDRETALLCFLATSDANKNSYRLSGGVQAE